MPWLEAGELVDRFATVALLCILLEGALNICELTIGGVIDGRTTKEGPGKFCRSGS